MKINKVYIKREETREQLREEAANMSFPATNGTQLIHGDFNGKSKGIPDNSIDLIFTDPPYAVEFLHLYSELAKIAERVLKPGGRLIMHTGGYSLPEVINQIPRKSSLRWNCDLIIEHTSPTKPMHGQKVFVRHKTLFYFLNGDKNNSPHYIDTLIHSKPVDKIAHDW
jgi:SAM-dependent methyltransferase